MRTIGSRLRLRVIVFVLLTLGLTLALQAGSTVASVLASGSFSWPLTGQILVPFDRDHHRGVDIGAEVGVEVRAIGDGVVHWVGKTPRGEPFVTIDHPGGISSTYVPVDETVGRGSAVSAGARLGIVSGSGEISSTSPHLHLAMYETETRGSTEDGTSLEKVYLDPLSYMGPMPALGSGATGAEQEAGTVPVAAQPDGPVQEPGVSPGEGTVVTPSWAQNLPAPDPDSAASGASPSGRAAIQASGTTPMGVVDRGQASYSGLEGSRPNAAAAAAAPVSADLLGAAYGERYLSSSGRGARGLRGSALRNELWRAEEAALVGRMRGGPALASPAWVRTTATRLLRAGIQSLGGSLAFLRPERADSAPWGTAASGTFLGLLVAAAAWAALWLCRRIGWALAGGTGALLSALSS